MKKTIKNLFLLLVVAIALVSIYQPFSVSREIEKRVKQSMEDAGLEHVDVAAELLGSNVLNFRRIAFEKNDIKVDIKNLRIEAEHLPVAEIAQGNYANLRGMWQVEEVIESAKVYPLPPLSGSGEFLFKDNRPEINGELHSAEKAVAATFVLKKTLPRTVEVHSADGKEVGLMPGYGFLLTLPEAQIPWEGAIISAKDIQYVFDDPKPLYLILYVKKLELAHLLNLVIGDKATGTGSIGGAVPVIIAPDGSFKPGEGHFTAEGEGIISVSPDALPGENSQMQLAREALSNFHYEKLLLTSTTDDNGKLSLSLEIEGNNPDAFDGKPVKLNVNFTGDVLELLQQTLIPSSDPRQFLEKK